MPDTLAIPDTPEVATGELDNDYLLISRWLKEHAESTREEYARDVSRFLSYVDVGLRGVTLGHLQSWRDHLEEDLAASTVKRKLAAVKSLLSFGAETQYLSHNVGAALTMPTPNADRTRRTLSQSALEQVLAEADTLRNHTLLHLLYASGGRVSDLEGLTWGDLSPRDDVGGQVRFLGKGDKARTVTLPEETWALLEALRGEHGPEEPVFCSREGGPLSKSQMWRVVKQCATAAGIEVEEGTSNVSPHWFRHAHATQALKNGADLELVRDTLGHESIRTTQEYLHARPEESSSQYLGGLDTENPEE